MLRAIWRFYAPRLRRHARQLLVGVAGSLLAALLLLAFPWLIRRAFDVAIPNERYGLLFMLALGAVGIQLVYLGVSIFVRRINFTVSGALSAELRRAAIEKLYRLSDASCAYLDRASLHARFIIDIERVDQMTGALVGMLLPSLVVGSLLIAGLVAISWPLAILAIAVFALFIPLTRRVAARYQDQAQRHQHSVRSYSAKMETSIGNLLLTRLKAAEKRDIDGHRAAIDSLVTDTRRVALWRGFFTELQNLFAFATAVALLGVGIAAAQQGWLTIGDALAFYVFAMLFRGQYVVFAQALTPVMEGFYSLSTVQEVLELEELPDYGGSRKIDFQGNVEMRGVTFGYGGEPLLRGIDLVVRRGQRVGIVGPNGSGKTTIVKLILGILAPDGGEVLVDSVPLAEIDLPALRRQVGVVLQEPMILAGTLLDNIAYGDDSPNLERAQRAARIAGLDELVRSRAGGWSSPIGDRGGALSGGQRQKIALARAVYGDPVLLVLDEPSNHLDEQSVTTMLDALARLEQAPAVLVISHDRGVLSSMDRRCRLEGGLLMPAD